MKRSFIALIKKEFRHIFRDRWTMVILLGIPIVQIILFGFAISTEVTNVRVAVYDPSNDAATQSLIERFDANPYFTITSHLHTPQQIDEVMAGSETDMVLVFPERFRQQLLHARTANIQLLVDATDPNIATAIESYATAIVAAYQPEGLPRTGTLPGITAQVKMLYNPQMNSAYHFVPGVMGLILILICAMMTSISIVRERERGTMEVLLVSPMRPWFVVMAKVIPYFVLSCVNLASVLLLSVFVLQVPVAGSLIWLLLLSFIYILLALSLGLLISTLVTTQMAAMLASGMVLMYPVLLLSGMIFPIESMPAVLQVVSHLIPARWYIAGVKKLMIEGLSGVYVWKEFAILSGMTFVVLMLSLKKFKIRLE